MEITNDLSGVYRIRNLVTGDSYIGATEHMRTRWNTHRLNFKSHTHSYRMQAAYDQYGPDAFIYEVLLICSPSDLHFFETRAVAVLKPTYNCKPVYRKGYRAA